MHRKTFIERLPKEHDASYPGGMGLEAKYEARKFCIAELVLESTSWCH